MLALSESWVSIFGNMAHLDGLSHGSAVLARDGKINVYCARNIFWGCWMLPCKLLEIWRLVVGPGCPQQIWVDGCDTVMCHTVLHHIWTQITVALQLGYGLSILLAPKLNKGVSTPWVQKYMCLSSDKMSSSQLLNSSNSKSGNFPTST